jgi:signal peptidase
MPQATSATAPVSRSLEVILALWDELRAAPGPHRFVMRGVSMWPAVPEGSILEVRPCASRDLLPGQMVTFRRGNTVVTHRVRAIDERGRVAAWGDSVLRPDAPIEPDDVLGEATLVRRGRLRDRASVRLAVRRLLAEVARRSPFAG